MREARGRAAVVALLALLTPSLAGLAAPQATVAFPGDEGLDGLPAGELPTGVASACGAGVEVPAAPPEGEPSQVLRQALLAGPVTVWTSLNMGPGSCLDADTLDGYHGDDFLDRIAVEAAARAAGDARLDGRIEAIHLDIAESIAAEAAERARDDAALHALVGAKHGEVIDALEAERGARAANDSALAGRIEAEARGLAEAVRQEAGERLAADHALQDQVGRIDGFVNGGAFRGTSMDIAGDVRWSGALVQGTVPWARLEGFPAACPAGQFVEAVGASLGCAAPPAPPAPPTWGRGRFLRTVVDAAGDVGEAADLTVGADGLPLIGYRDADRGHLKVAHCEDVACSRATVSTLDAAPDAGRSIDLVVGADGLGLIGYLNDAGHAKLARCVDLACTRADIRVLAKDSAGVTAALALGADGLPLLAYHALEGGRSLKVARCLDADCVQVRRTLAVPAVFPVHASASLGSDGLPVISYLDVSRWSLTVTHCEDADCARTTNATVDRGSFGEAIGEHGSMTIGADGLPIISYTTGSDGVLKVAHCENVTCTTATVSTLGAGWRAMYTSIAVGVDGHALIAFYDSASDDLRLGRCSDTACTSATVHSVDTAGDVGAYASLALGVDGLPVVAYHDGSGGDLKVAHFGNRFGVPFHQP